MNYIVEDNFFKEPDSIRKYALTLKYYNKKNHLEDLVKFPGYRTDYFHKINPTFQKNIHNILLPYIAQLENVKNILDKYTKYNLQTSFSYTLNNSNSFKHIDEKNKDYKIRYGGIVYLYPQPPKKSGTTLFLKNTTYIDNKYNRFVLYNSNIEHEPTGNFGDNINNSRLVLTIFYDLA